MTAQARGKSKWLVHSLVGAAAGVLVAGLWAMSGKRGATTPRGPAAKPAVAVTVEPLAQRSVQRLVNVVGTLYGRDRGGDHAEGRRLGSSRFAATWATGSSRASLLAELDSTDYRLAVPEESSAVWSWSWPSWG